MQAEARSSQGLLQSAVATAAAGRVSELRRVAAAGLLQAETPSFAGCCCR